MRFFSFSIHLQSIHHNRIRQGKKFLTVLTFLIMSFQIFGQSSFTWYFGTDAGIKFNTDGTSVPMTGSFMNTTEGSTVTSDTAGVIIFYSDGLSVWDNSSSTPVFTNLLGSTSSTQAALAVTIPGTNCQRFLIFTTKGVEPGGNHDLGVALVNVTGTSPNYIISVSAPALSVLQPAGAVFFSEKLAATSDTAGGYWVVAHNYVAGAGTANTFYKYHITAAGFSTVTTTAQAQAALSSVQQTQSIGSNHQDLSTPYYNGQGQMKFSKAGQKLALVLAGSKIIDLFNFDLSTGNLTAIATTTVNPSNGNLYGCELSPLGNRLYASEGFAQSGTTVRKIYQYDISGGTLSSPYTVASGNNVYNNRYKYNALQLGPNDKIYCSEEMGISFLSVIQNPNISGSGCGWSSMTEPIAGTNSLGLTTVMSNSGCICLPSPGAVTGPSIVCRGAAGKVYSVSAVPGATGYNWILPAGVVVTSGNNTNTITVTFTGTSVSGTIRANAYNSYCTGVNTPPFPVTVTTPPVVTLGPDQTICQGQSVTFNAGACNGCTYQWANLTTGQPNIGTGQTYTTGIAGIYTVAVTGLGNCIGYDTVQLFVQTAVPVSVTISASANPVCAGTQVTFSAVAQPVGGTTAYTWKVNGITVSGATNSTYTYVPLNGDCVVCVYSTNSSCASGSPATSNQVCMTVNQNLPVSVTITASENPVCAGTSVTFTAFPFNPGGFPLYQWYVNSILTGASTSTFTYVPVNGDCITCSLSSSNTCATGNPA
ncbi:MAG: PKD domain-containing protein, partial [Bacteroidota bacterium]